MVQENTAEAMQWLMIGSGAALAVIAVCERMEKTN